MDLLQTLQWYGEMGVDEAIGEMPATPTIRLIPVVMNTRSKMPAPVNSNAAPATPIISPASAALDSKKLAESCTSRADLEKAVREFKGLGITKTATNTVFCDGNPEAKIMLIGEAPGAEEDAQGIPFCGPSGQMLDQMFSCIDMTRQKNFYITNTVFWRPPGNRRPTPEELAVCKPFVEKHIALVNPSLIVLVGGTAIASVLDSDQGITKLRGKFMDYKNPYISQPIQTTAIFHPSYLLRSPGQKQLAWRDLLMLKHYMIERKISV